MTFQAYIDDSYTPDGAFVLAGHIATADQWAKFSEEWSALLPRFGVLNKDGQYVFKRTAMLHRVKDMAPFFRLIEDNLLASVSVSFLMRDLKTAAERIYIPNFNVTTDKSFMNPYFYAFFGMFSAVHKLRTTIGLSRDSRIDFVFDEQGEKAFILENWNAFLHFNPEVKDLFGSTPRFERDEDFLPLQAADFWAGWVRQWHEQDALENAVKGLDFGPFRGRDQNVGAFVTFSEDHLCWWMMQHVMALAPGVLVYDTKYDGIVSPLDEYQSVVKRVTGLP